MHACLCKGLRIMSGFDRACSDNSSALRILVLGYIVRCPIGGMAWHHLQYVTGLARLGHEVLFVEDSGDEPWACYDPGSGECGTDPAYGLEFTRRVFERVGLDRHWAYHDAFTDSWHGPGAQLVTEFCNNADMLLNLSGANPIREQMLGVPIRVYLDTDPLFTQVRILQDPERQRLAAAHNMFFSFGEKFGDEDCGIPDDGFPWQPTRQPIDLYAWQFSSAPAHAAFTTVMQWDSYSKQSHEGREYGMKAESFGPYMDLPQHTDVELEIAMGSVEAPRQQLKELGWHLRNPLEVTRDPWSYQDYIYSSGGEFSVAKHGYVASHSGWFSERSACYLASGRPVITQETGFSSIISADAGLIPFTSLQNAQTGLEAVKTYYNRHCEAARDIAMTYFDSNKVLNSLLERAFSKNAKFLAGTTL